MSQTIKVIHKTIGILVEENFSDAIQFKIFLQTINGCLKTNSDLDFFNGINFLLHIPYDILKESVVFTKVLPDTLTEKMIGKSLIEGR